ncbi:MAG: hypothetical protein FRX49_13844 [Trebouxia sp. A1-2]|nr:MAG: hypothetical protein FRX49_13844 [Trebouxia sp. A1-2]
MANHSDSPIGAGLLQKPQLPPPQTWSQLALRYCWRQLSFDQPADEVVRHHKALYLGGRGRGPKGRQLGFDRPNGDNNGTIGNVTKRHRDIPAPPLPVVMVPLGKRPVFALPHIGASSGNVLPKLAVRPAS